MDNSVVHLEIAGDGMTTQKMPGKIWASESNTTVQSPFKSKILVGIYVSGDTKGENLYHHDSRVQKLLAALRFYRDASCSQYDMDDRKTGNAALKAFEEEE